MSSLDKPERTGIHQLIHIYALEAVAHERSRQDEKWGKPPTASTDLRWFAILSEEVGEVAKELVERKDRIDVMSEVVHVAAVAVRWLEDYYHGLLVGGKSDQPTDGSGS